MATLNIVILAAGRGTRMYSDRPKVLQPLAGRSLLAHVLDAARKLSPQKICVVYGHGGELVPQTIADPDIIWVKQEPQLGTGHALLQALPHLDASAWILVLYGDVPLISHYTLSRLLQEQAPGTLGLLTVNLDDPAGYGRILRGPEGRITGIIEQKDANESQRLIQEVNTGIMALPGEYLPGWLNKLGNNNSQKEYYLTDIIGLAVDEGLTIQAIHPEHLAEVLGINSKAQLAHLERWYQTRYAESLLAQGVTLYDPARVDVRGELSCGRDVEIDVNCVFAGRVELGDGVRIAANCYLENVSIAADTHVAAFCHLVEAKIGNHCKIGPYARIRPGTELQEAVHIGNFVEVKNSAVGLASKINHLSYVGDTTIGKNVNVGAGTITCNYDGANKHRTIIEDDVFIGSDTQLIAPVTVSKGATIGAGSTITRDAPPGELTLARAKQTSISGWQRPQKRPK